MTNLLRDLIVFEKTDDLLLLFLFRHGTAKLNEKNIIRSVFRVMLQYKHTNTVYPMLYTRLLSYYYEFPS